MITGPNIIQDGLIFGYDADDRSTRFYKGEPTTNLFNISKTNRTLGIVQPASILTYGTSTIIDGEYAERIIKSGTTVSYESYRLGVSVTSGITYTVSFFVRLISGDIRTIGVHFLGGNQTNSPKYNINNDYYFTFSSSPTISSLNCGVGFLSTYNIDCYIYKPQVEQKSHSTQFTNYIRSATNALIDLKKTSTIDLTNMSFDTTAHPYFNGSGYMSASTDLFDIGVSDFTVSMWIKYTDITGYQCLLDGGYSANKGILIESDGASKKIRIYIGNTVLAITVNWNFFIGIWYNVIFVRQSGVIYAYVNCSQIGSSANTTSIVKNNYLIGKYSSGEYFNGKMPILKMYNKALSETEILQDYNAYHNRIVDDIIKDGLILYLDASNPNSYPGSGTTFYDLSGFEHHHTISNSPTYNSTATIGSFTLNGSNQGFTYSGSLTDSALSTVVIFYKTTEIQELWLMGIDGYYYLSASNNNNYYHSLCGSPLNYIDLNSVSNPYSAGYKNGNYHMFEAKNVNFQNWTIFKWFGYYSSGWQLAGDVSMVLVYNRSLSSDESLHNFNVLKDRFGL